MEITEELQAQRTECDVYSRVVGYLQPVIRWNKGKKAEFEQRVAFRLKHDVTE